MNLEPRAKAVRIRILSNGKENSSLEELKSNFNLRDVACLMFDDRLFRWLRQRNELELADRLKQIDGASTILDKYVKIVSMFFPSIKETDNPIDVIKYCFSNDSPIGSQNGYILLSAILKSKRTESIRPAILQFWNELLSASGNFKNLAADFCSELANSDKTNGENTYNLRKKLPDAAKIIRDYLLTLASEKGCEKAKKEIETTNIFNVFNRMIKDARNKKFDSDKYFDECKTDKILFDSYLLVYKICYGFRWCIPNMYTDFQIRDREIKNLSILAENVIGGRRRCDYRRIDDVSLYNAIKNKFKGVMCVSNAVQSYKEGLVPYRFTSVSLDNLANLLVNSKNNSFIQSAIENCFGDKSNEYVCLYPVLDELLERVKTKL